MKENIMTKFKNFILVIFIITLIGCAQTEVGVMTFPVGSVQHIVRGDKIKWKKCPPSLPQGCELRILEGNPKKPELFTIRFRLDDTFFMPPHTHPKEERVTILEGNVSIAFGIDAKHVNAVNFGAGDYYVNARNSIHTVWIDSPSIIQITGIGPWEVNFVNNNYVQ